MAGPKTYTANYKSGKGRKNAVPEEDGYGHLQPPGARLGEGGVGRLDDREGRLFSRERDFASGELYEPRHQLIYEAIRKLNIEQKPVDILTVTDELKRSGHLEAVGGPFYITQLSGLVASAAHIEYHARIIAQKYLARELISYTSNIQTKAFDNTQDVDELMQEAEENSLNFLSAT